MVHAAAGQATEKAEEAAADVGVEVAAAKAVVAAVAMALEEVKSASVAVRCRPARW